MAFGNYSITADNVFKNRTFEDLLKPLSMYTEAYNAAETQMNELVDKSNVFKYLSETLPEGSKSRQIYEGYANDLDKYIKDFATNGMNIQNTRGLMDMRRRFTGEIGRLMQADTALKKEQDLRRSTNLKDPTMLYSNDNPTIDDFLEGVTPNLYSISGNELYKRGATASQQASSRVFEDTQVQNISKYYQDLIQRQGYRPELLAAFRNDLSIIPEFNDAVDSILLDMGVVDNLSGANYARARESVINGIIDGAIYKESRNVQRNLGVMTPSEAQHAAIQNAQDRRAAEAFELSLLQSGMTRNDAGKIIPMKNHPLYSTDENGNIVLKDDINPAADGGNGIMIGSNGNLQYGKGGKGGSNNTTLTPEEREEISDAKSRTKALYTLKPKDLLHDEGFDINLENGKSFHYDYIGGISRHSGTWYSGAMGEDIAPRGWAMTTSTNLASTWGNYTAENVGKGAVPKTRVVPVNDFLDLITTTGTDESGYPTVIYTPIGEQIEALLKKRYGQDMTLGDFNGDVELIEVPNEWDTSKVSYLVAVRENK